jgi:hypothetical protein
MLNVVAQRCLPSVAGTTYPAFAAKSLRVTRTVLANL